MLAYVREQLVPIPINRTTLNELFDLDLKTDEEAADYLASRAEPVDEIRTSEDVVINAVGPRALRALLPRLHAQAMGPRPERARQAGDGADPDPNQHRRPLFHRHVPGDAARRLHGDVQAHAQQPADRGPHRRRFPRRARQGRFRSSHLHRPGRRIFRFPLRQAAVPQPEVRPSDAGPGAVPADRDGQLSRPRTCRSPGSASTSI